MFMGFLHQFLEIIGSSKVRIDLGEIFRPIAVVAIATLPQIGAIEILHHRGDPNAIPAHTTWKKNGSIMFIPKSIGKEQETSKKSAGWINKRTYEQNLMNSMHVRMTIKVEDIWSFTLASHWYSPDGWWFLLRCRCTIVRHHRLPSFHGSGLPPDRSDRSWPGILTCQRGHDACYALQGWQGGENVKHSEIRSFVGPGGLGWQWGTHKNQQEPMV